MCGRLLGVAAASLAATPSLVGVSVGITLVGGAAGGVFALLAAAGAANGVLVPAVGAAADAPACVWQPAPVGVAAAALCALAAAWTIATAAALRTFVAAGATAQWFASPRGTRRVVGAAQSSFAAGAGPQLGTCAAAGAVKVAADAARAAVDAATTRDDGAPAGLLAALLSGAARAALALLECLTRFALVAAAISGQPLLASGKAATTLLRRVALSAVAVWYVPPLVLHTAAGAAAVVWGGVVAAVVKGSVSTPSAPSAHLAVGAAAGWCPLHHPQLRRLDPAVRRGGSLLPVCHGPGGGGRHAARCCRRACRSAMWCHDQQRRHSVRQACATVGAGRGARRGGHGRVIMCVCVCFFSALWVGSGGQCAAFCFLFFLCGVETNNKPSPLPSVPPSLHSSFPLHGPPITCQTASTSAAPPASMSSRASPLAPSNVA